MKEFNLSLILYYMQLYEQKIRKPNTAEWYWSSFLYSTGGYNSGKQTDIITCSQT